MASDYAAFGRFCRYCIGVTGHSQNCTRPRTCDQDGHPPEVLYPGHPWDSGPGPEITADDLVTDVTGAPTEADALAALNGVPRAMLVEVADLIGLDPIGHADATVRRMIVAEARA